MSSSALRLSSPVSAGGVLIHSVLSRLRCPFLRAPLLRPPFCPPAPPVASFCPFTARRTLDFLVFRPLPACLSHSQGMGTAGRNTTSPAKIHRDFNTFNSFIIRFAPTLRAGNARHAPLSALSSPLAFSHRQAVKRSSHDELQLQLARTRSDGERGWYRLSR